MNEQPSSHLPRAQAPQNVAPATVMSGKRRFSPVWIVPILAVLIGLWLVWQHFAAKGPEVEVRFETAEGIEAGKTPVQCRSVGIGVVDAVRLAPDLKSVLITLRIGKDSEGLLHSDTRFWVVRPRFGGSGISGLGTLVSGSFIEVDPGSASTTSRNFVGLENPPVTPLGVPGLHITLIAAQAGSIDTGSSISYKGIKVGRIESRIFNAQNGRVEFGAFVEGDFGKIITNRSRFWNVSGFNLDVGSAGVHLRTGTLESIVAGGVAFDAGPGGERAENARDGAIFPLYDSFEDTKETSINPTLTYLLLFKDSVRGLSPEAPVEFRGIQVGTTVGVSFNYLPGDPERRVPVLIRIDPTLLGDLPNNDVNGGQDMIAESVRRGLRATLRTGSLLTGQLFVDLTLQADAQPAEVVELGGYQTLPTVSSGLNLLQDRVSALLDKIQALKIEDTVASANGALDEIKGAATELRGTISGLDKIVSSQETQALPNDVQQSLAELNKTLTGFNQNSRLYRDLVVAMQDMSKALRSIDSLSTTVERKPNSLIFGNPRGVVKPPKGTR